MQKGFYVKIFQWTEITTTFAYMIKMYRKFYNLLKIKGFFEA
jgi:hypothetical protein